MDVAPKLRSIRKDAINLARPRGGARPLIVLGCQRSGTNALVGCFESDPRAKVYQERCGLNVPRRSLAIRDSRRYSLRLRPLPEVARRLRRVPFPLAVLKPLVESHRIDELLAALPEARIVWLYRFYGDVAESNARVFGADAHRRNLEPIVAGDSGNWRSAGASELVRETVSRHYEPGMSPRDGGALFWWARNQLLFDQGPEALQRVALLRYARFVADPEWTIAGLYELAGVEAPSLALAGDITPRYIGRGDAGPISPALRELCEELWQRICRLDPQEPDPASRADSRTGQGSRGR